MYISPKAMIETLELCKADDGFTDELVKPFDKLIKEGGWYIQKGAKALYMFHPMEISKYMDCYKMKCFVVYNHGNENPMVVNLEIGKMFTASKITQKKLLSELDAELAKAMLTDNIPPTRRDLPVYRSYTPKH